jgi:hypothetical protein
MKLIDATKEHGHPFMVPDCPRSELPVFFKEMCYNIGVEIGVWEGEFTEKFCKEGIKMYGIDPWRARGKQSQVMQDNRCLRAIERLKPYGCEIIRKRSMEAVTDFEDGSLDFVYIDGDHRYAFVVEDIREWSKKVRSGGIVSGHDYACTDPEINGLPERYRKHEEVGRAVDEYIEANGIEDFYTLGRSRPLEEEVMNDRLLSWFFIKK